MHKAILALAVVAGFSLPAYAFQCPADMAKIDQALESTQLSDADRARVVELRQQGEESHAAGQHQASVDALAEAMEILGL